MKNNILLILMLLAGPVFSQNTKKVTVKSDYPSTKETYYVLKSEKKVMHGNYEKEFHGETLKKGQFLNNQRTGVWEYYDLNGKVVHKVDIVKEELVSSTENPKFDTDKYSRPLIILGGFDALFKQIGYSLRYPAEARRKGTQGKVYVKLSFNDAGFIEDIQVMQGAGDGLDEEAIRVIKLIDIETLPALDKNGKPTTSELTFPVNFQLG